MQIPEHWAEAQVTGKVKGRKRIVRRFGWSDVSAEEAQRHADERARAAMAELQAGRPVAQREQKLPYGGNGLPIREQVLARNDDLVVTRNSYGSRCLNEPDVLFADIDYEPRLPELVERMLTAIGFVVGLACFAMALRFFWLRDPRLGCGTLAACLLLPGLLWTLRVRLRHHPRMAAASRRRTNARVRRVAASHPHGRFALYETPAGLRVLALHQTFDPTSPATRDLLREFGSDPAYVQMCELQSCFRARVSGKPWRMGVRHIVPRPGVWPVHPDRLALREQWIAEYETAAAAFAACRFLEEVGTGPVHPRCAAVRRMHDEMSKANSTLPIA